MFLYQSLIFVIFIIPILDIKSKKIKWNVIAYSSKVSFIQVTQLIMHSKENLSFHGKNLSVHHQHHHGVQQRVLYLRIYLLYTHFLFSFVYLYKKSKSRRRKQPIKNKKNGNNANLINVMLMFSHEQQHLSTVFWKLTRACKFSWFLYRNPLR